jgi:hypothetical protein
MNYVQLSKEGPSELRPAGRMRPAAHSYPASDRDK